MEEIREAVTKKKVKIQRRRPGRKKWWNKECRESSKTGVNRKLKKYKAVKIDRKQLAIEKKRRKRICKGNE